MRVKLVFYGGLKRDVGAPEQELHLESDELTLSELLAALAQRYPKLHGRLSSVACAIGSQIVGRDHKIRDGDEIALLPPVSGG